MFKEAPPLWIVTLVNEIRLAERFGWTLDYVRTLDPFDVAAILGVIDGDAKVEAQRQRRNKRSS